MFSLDWSKISLKKLFGPLFAFIILYLTIVLLEFLQLIPSFLLLDLITLQAVGALAGLAGIVLGYLGYISSSEESSSYQEIESEHIDQLINELNQVTSEDLETLHDFRSGYSSVWSSYEPAVRTKFPSKLRTILDSYAECLREFDELVEQEEVLAEKFITRLPGGKVSAQYGPAVITSVEETPTVTPQPWSGPFRELLWKYQEEIFSAESADELKRNLLTSAEKNQYRGMSLFEWYDNSWLRSGPRSATPWEEVFYEQKENKVFEEDLEVVEQEYTLREEAEQKASEANSMLESEYR